MNNTDKKKRFIELRAAGNSYQTIATELNVSKSTLTRWNKELSADIAQIKQKDLEALYQSYGMAREARIKQLGEIIKKIDKAIDAADLSEVAPEKLLDLKLKYLTAIKAEYIEPAPALDDNLTAQDLLNAYRDLINRLRAGTVDTGRAKEEAALLDHALKAYDSVVINKRVDDLERLSVSESAARIDEILSEISVDDDISV